MPNTSWLDIELDGKRLERVIKMCMTNLKEAKELSIKFAYMDRFIKATHEKVELAKIVLDVKKTISEAKKPQKEAEPIAVS